LYELISGGQEEAFTAGITGNEGKFENTYLLSRLKLEESR